MSDLHPIMRQALAPFLGMTASVTPADVYRGWKISHGRWPEPEWLAYSPDYDASWEGEEDGFVDNGQKASGPTREALIAEIDEWFEDNAPVGICHACNGAGFQNPQASAAPCSLCDGSGASQADAQGDAA